jgi:hypothetical protein
VAHFFNLPPDVVFAYPYVKYAMHVKAMKIMQGSDAESLTDDDIKALEYIEKNSREIKSTISNIVWNKEE